MLLHVARIYLLIASGLVWNVSQAQELKELRLAIISKTPFYMPVWAGIDQGFYDQHGLKIEIDVTRSADKATSGLKDGGYHIAIAPPDGVLKDLETGTTLRIIAGNTSKLPHDLIAQPQFKTVADLKGAKIGVVSLTEGTTFLFQRIASAHGLAPQDYILDAVGGAPTRWQLLQERTIDAGLQSIPLNYIAEDKGFINLGRVADYVPDYQFTSVNVNGDWAEANRQVVIDFLKATLAATKWLYENSEPAAELLAREMAIELQYAQKTVADYTRDDMMPLDMGISVKGLHAVAEIMQASGALSSGKSSSDKLAQEADFNPLNAVDLQYLEAARK